MSVGNLPLPSDSDADESGSTNEASDCMTAWSVGTQGFNTSELTESGSDSPLKLGTESDHVNDSSSESEDNTALNETMPVHLSSPLYEGSAITIHQFDVSLSLIAQRHNLTYACQTDILRFISVLLPPPNSVRSTARSLNKKFVHYNEQTRIHRCCGVCMHHLAVGERCSQSECLSQNVADATFVEVPLDKQLQERFKGE